MPNEDVTDEDQVSSEGTEIEIEIEGGAEDEEQAASTGGPAKADAAEESHDDEAGEGDEGDIEDYGARVQKRIRKMAEQKYEAEKRAEEAANIAKRAIEENKHLKSRVGRLDSGYLNEYGARIEAELADARRQYKESYDKGDTDGVIAAQEKLTRATGDKSRYDQARTRADQQQRLSQLSRPQAQPQQAQMGQPQQAPMARPQAAPTDPKAKEWADKNAWFGTDEVMTYAALGVHRQLIEEEGFDAGSDEYYANVDRRMRKEFPARFEGQKNTRAKKQVAPAASSASRSTKSGRKTVKLTTSQVAMAKKLNVPLEEYAKYVE